MSDKEVLPSIDEVFSRFAHDLRTPLAVVHTTTSLLLNPKYNLTPEQVREQLERIQRNVALMNRMLSELTDARAGPDVEP